MKRFILSALPLVLLGCVDQKPSALQEQLFGYYEAPCAPSVGDPVLPENALSARNFLKVFGDQLTLIEHLYFSNANCHQVDTFPASYETSVLFNAIDASDIQAPYSEIAVSKYSVQLIPGGLSRSMRDSQFCGYTDWQTYLPKDVTACTQEQNGAESRDKKRWILYRKGLVVKLGFLSRDVSFDPSRVEWLSGEFRKTQD